MPRKGKPRQAAGAWGDAKKWQNTLTGGLKFGMLRSTMADNDLILGQERFNIITKGMELDRAIDNFHDNQMNACRALKTAANKESVELYEKILFLVRWAHPRISLAYKENIAAYVKHLLSANPVAYCHERSLVEAMIAKAGGGEGEKVYKALARMILKIRKLTVMAYLKIQKTKSIIVSTRAKMVVKKESTLRWMMETNPGRKDRFWTSWYYASRGMAADLERHLVWAKRRTLEAFVKQWGAMEEEAGQGEVSLDSAANADTLRPSTANNGKLTASAAATGDNKLATVNTAASSSADTAVTNANPGQQDWRMMLAKHEAWKKAQTNDVNERDPDFGLAPIHYAAKRGDLNVVRLLIKHGASVNIKAPDGRTPLHFAAAYSNREVVLELLSYWADVDAKDNYGCTAAVLAEQAQNRATYQACMNWNGLLDEGPYAGGIEDSVDFGASSHVGAAAGADGAFGSGSARPTAGAYANDNKLPGVEGLLGSDEGLEGGELGFDDGQDEDDEMMDEYDEEEDAYCNRPPSPIPQEIISTMSAELQIFARRFEHAPGATTATSTSGVDPSKRNSNIYMREPREIAADPRYSTFLDMRVCEKFATLCRQQGFVYENIKALKRWFTLAKGLVADNQSQSQSQGQSQGQGQGSTNNSDPSANTATTSPGILFPPAACVAIGLQLVEALIRYKQEGLALYYLDECLGVSGLEDYSASEPGIVTAAGSADFHIGDSIVTGDEKEGAHEEKGGESNPHAPPKNTAPGATIVGLLARKTEVLLCMLDIHQTLARQQQRALQHSTSFADLGTTAPPGPESVSLLHSKLMQTGSVYVGSSGIITGYRSTQPGQMQHPSSPSSPLSPGRSASFAGSSVLNSASVGGASGSTGGKKDTVEVCLRRLQMPGEAWDPLSESDFAALQGQSMAQDLDNGHSNADFNFALGEGDLREGDSPGGPPRSPDRRRRRMRGADAPIGTSNYPTHTPPMLYLAQSARQTIETAIAIVEHEHYNDLCEPFAICPLLELLADVTEREGDPQAALDVYMRAEVVCKRTIGSVSSGCVRVMIEVLRLTIICASDAQGYDVASHRAKELTRIIDKLALVAPADATFFSSKIVNLISLATLLDKGQATVKCLESATDQSVSVAIARAELAKLIIKPRKQVFVPGMGEVWIGGVRPKPVPKQRPVSAADSDAVGVGGENDRAAQLGGGAADSDSAGAAIDAIPTRGHAHGTSKPTGSGSHVPIVLGASPYFTPAKVRAPKPAPAPSPFVPANGPLPALSETDELVLLTASRILARSNANANPDSSTASKLRTALNLNSSKSQSAPLRGGTKGNTRMNAKSSAAAPIAIASKSIFSTVAEEDSQDGLERRRHLQQKIATLLQEEDEANASRARANAMVNTSTSTSSYFQHLAAVPSLTVAGQTTSTGSCVLGGAFSALDESISVVTKTQKHLDRKQRLQEAGLYTKEHLLSAGSISSGSLNVSGNNSRTHADASSEYADDVNKIKWYL